jgi:hypothetical protein
MSRNGSGTYTLPAGNPVVTNTTISSTWANTTLADIATALSGSLASDGQTTATGNLQMGNNKIVNLDDGTSASDAVNYGQLLAVAGGTGRIVQTVRSTGTSASTSSTGYVATGHTATITPTSSTSKILVFVNAMFWQTNVFFNSANSYMALYRNGINAQSGDWIMVNANVNGASGANIYAFGAIMYLDSPATTSATIYQPYIRADGNGACVYNASGNGTVTLLEITA